MHSLLIFKAVADSEKCFERMPKYVKADKGLCHKINGILCCEKIML